MNSLQMWSPIQDQASETRLPSDRQHQLVSVGYYLFFKGMAWWGMEMLGMPTINTHSLQI